MRITVPLGTLLQSGVLPWTYASNFINEDSRSRRLQVFARALELAPAKARLSGCCNGEWQGSMGGLPAGKVPTGYFRSPDARHRRVGTRAEDSRAETAQVHLHHPHHRAHRKKG